jgi:hypothetical protein
MLNNPCALECSTGSTKVDVNVDIDFNSIFIQQAAECLSCELQKQTQNGDCFDFMNGDAYYFQYQSGIASGYTFNGIWGISATLDNVLVYNNTNFYSGSSAPTRYDYLLELDNIANVIGSDFTYVSGTTASFISDYNCTTGLGLLGKLLNIDLNLDIIIN